MKPISAYDEGDENVTIHTQTTHGTYLLFGGLDPNTDYVVTIATADENGTIYNDYYLSSYFKTRKFPVFKVYEEIFRSEQPLRC